MITTLEAKNIDGEWLTAEQAIKKHYKLVFHAIKPLQTAISRSCESIDDIYAVGMEGLFKAYLHFDPDRNVRFSGVAYRFIQTEVRNYLWRQDYGIHFPREIKVLGTKIVSLGLTEKTAEEIGETLGVKVHHVQQALRFIEVGKADSLQHIIEKEKQKTAENLLGQEYDFSIVYVRDFLSKFDDREKKAIYMRMEGYTFREIGETLGISAEGVRKMLQKVAERYSRVS